MRAILILMLTAGAAVADQKTEALQRAGFMIVTAYNCQGYELSALPYEAAIPKARAQLVASGYSDREADQAMERFKSVENAKPNADGKVTKQLCEMLLDRLK
ncbi:hypothetical protein [Neorhizobium vignae]|uniref:hypothetical protein n=1 Tax=Neorhizobium vignae TaxID=690585 RepID=UPI00056B6C5A|nr:hypothetical protein [Neorhizobium vignae]